MCKNLWHVVNERYCSVRDSINTCIQKDHETNICSVLKVFCPPWTSPFYQRLFFKFHHLHSAEQDRLCARNKSVGDAR